MNELMERLNRFAETPAGKAVLALAAVVVIAVAGFVVYSALNPSGSQQLPTPRVEQQGTGAAESTATATPATGEAPGEASVGSGLEVFGSDLLRDPFEPFAAAATTATTTTAATETATRVPSIGLIGVHYQDGELAAEVSYEGSARTVRVGESAGPYLLLKVYGDRATFLYESSSVTLRVGETYVP